MKLQKIHLFLILLLGLILCGCLGGRSYMEGMESQTTPDNNDSATTESVSYTHLTLPPTPYV